MLHFFYVQTVHHPVKLFLGYSICITAEVLRKMKSAVFYALVQQTKAVSVLEQYFYLVAMSVVKHKHCTAHRVKLNLLFDYGNKAVKTLSHICVCCGNVDFGWLTQHGAHLPKSALKT